MSEIQSLIRLQTWLSPAFPTGAFAYSHGLEAAILNGFINDQRQLKDWLHALLVSGTGWNDSVLCAQSWHCSADPHQVTELADLAEALCFSAERKLETIAQGSAFLEASRPWVSIDGLPGKCALPVAVGAVAGISNIPLENTLAAYLHSFVSNQVQAALRLMKLGQQGGVEMLAELESTVIETASRAAKSSLNDLGSDTITADIVAIQHEFLDHRIFRS